MSLDKFQSEEDGCLCQYNDCPIHGCIEQDDREEVLTYMGSGQYAMQNAVASENRAIPHAERGWLLDHPTL